MDARVHDFDGSQESANFLRQIARAGVRVGLTDNDAVRRSSSLGRRGSSNARHPRFRPGIGVSARGRALYRWHFIVLCYSRFARLNCKWLFLRLLRGKTPELVALARRMP